jgi:VWFA-related protein
MRLDFPSLSVRKLFRLSLIVNCFLLLLFSAAHAQQPSQQAEDVLRIDTELVQTDVMVFDRQGRFVDNLQREQFELRVDGKPQPITFFERVASGNRTEERTRVEGRAPSSAPAPAVGSTERGRTVIFFIDDLHLELDSLNRTRQALKHFLDKDLNPGDSVLIASTSGQIGFLQQFTDNKSVLSAAIERLKYVPYNTVDSEQPRMTEYLALKVEHNDPEVINFYVEEFIKRNMSRRARKIDPRSLQGMIKNRAHQIVLAMEAVTTNTLGSLENLMRHVAQLSGRKLVVFFSDGFYLDSQKSGSTAADKLRRITDAAVRTGVVIYTIDARGLVSGQPDATGSRPFDPTGRLDRANIGEIMQSQDGLHALAGDTGGRALRNTFIFDQWVTKALKETANYYLLAWKPVDDQRGGKFKRIEVSIAGRPDLTVRLPRGYLDATAKALSARNDSSNTKSKDTKQAAAATTTTTVNQPASQSPALKTTDAELAAAVNSFAPLGSVPTHLNVSYLDTPNNGPMLTASVQISTGRLTYGDDGRQPATVDVAGVVFNEQGKSVNGFKTRLTVKPLQAASEQSSVIYNHKAVLKPGLYQVRTAARDEQSGLVGSAYQWIEIPDLTNKRLTLSSLLIGGQVIEQGAKKENVSAVSNPASEAGPQVQFSVDKRFRRSAKLSFWMFIYNAARMTTAGGRAEPELTAQVTVYRGGQAIVTAGARKLQTAGMSDLERIPYGGEFALSSLAPGRYMLQVTVTDRVSNQSAVQRSFFDVE